MQDCPLTTSDTSEESGSVVCFNITRDNVGEEVGDLGPLYTVGGD